MKLISCCRCGVVIDASRLNFPTDIHSDDMSIDSSRAAWNEDKNDYDAFVACPVCGEPVFDTKELVDSDSEFL